MLPIIVVLGMSFILSKYIFPHTNLNYLDKYNTTASKVIGNWSLIVSLIFSIIIAYIFNYKKMKNPIETLTKGVNGSFLAVMNTASEVSYGNVIVGLAAFVAIRGSVRFILKFLNFRSSICFITCRNNWFSIWGIKYSIRCIRRCLFKRSKCFRYKSWSITQNSSYCLWWFGYITTQWSSNNTTWCNWNDA